MKYLLRLRDYRLFSVLSSQWLLHVFYAWNTTRQPTFCGFWRILIENFCNEYFFKMSGLANVGNTCYVNVIFQLLSPFDYLFRILKDHEVHHVDGTYNNSLQLCLQELQATVCGAHNMTSLSSSVNVKKAQSEKMKSFLFLLVTKNFNNNNVYRLNTLKRSCYDHVIMNASYFIAANINPQLEGDPQEFFTSLVMEIALVWVDYFSLHIQKKCEFTFCIILLNYYFHIGMSATCLLMYDLHYLHSE